MTIDSTPFVRVRGLVQVFPTHVPGRGTVSIRALDGVDLDIGEGEAFGLVGESGSGKTTLARCLLRLTEPTAGTISVAGRELTGAGGSDLRAMRRQMQVVFQDPVGSLDPRARVRDVVAEPLRTHLHLTRVAVDARVLELLDDVGLARTHLDRRAHELSGGQCQRVAIARALALRPRLLVLDEPTSALDVSVQAQILNLLVALRAEHGLTYLLISHDLGVVRYVCDRIAVMYLGRIVEQGPADHILGTPEHPYTRGLMASRPSIDRDRTVVPMLGEPPSLTAPPSGCAFHPRCWLRPTVSDPARCVEQAPPLRVVGNGVLAACHFAGTSLLAPTAAESILEAPTPKVGP
jgi:peptide/nickel transport system ATP-binding protein